MTISDATLAALVAEVKAALQQATPGPWRAIRDGNAPLENGTLVGQSRVDGLPRPFEPRWIGWGNPRAARIAHHSTYLRDEDADLVAHAPEWLGALVQVVEDQQRQVDDLLAALKVIGIEPPAFPHEAWSLLLDESGPEAGDETAEATARMFMDDLTKRECEVVQLRADGQRLRERFQDVANRCRNRLIWLDKQTHAVRETCRDCDTTITNVLEIAEAALAQGDAP